MYLERPLTQRPRPTLRLNGRRFDVDYFGMDDGGEPDPDHARRFLFQLGAGYMIYLYVIQAGSTARLDLFQHSFWTKDCAVAEVEQEEHGPPTQVIAASMALPVLYGSVEVGAPARRFRIASLAFEAAPEQPQLMTFALEGTEGPAELRWRRGDGWSLRLTGEPVQVLGAREHLRFLDPLS